MPPFVSFYELSWYFFIYSLLGWLMESLINTIRQKTFINRGFLIGPYCPIYGTGMCLIYLTCHPLGHNLILIFLYGMITATLLEYMTGYLMEKLFLAKWWDYKRFKYNLHGYICLHISLAWGCLTVILICYIQPQIENLVTQIPLPLSQLCLLFLYLIFFIDFIYSTHTAFKLRAKFPALSQIRIELITLLEQSKFYETAEEFKNHFEIKKVSLKLNNLIESLKDHLPQSNEISKVQLWELLAVKLSKYHTQLNKFTMAEKRLLSAFPSLSLTPIKTLKAKLRKRGNEK